MKIKYKEEIREAEEGTRVNELFKKEIEESDVDIIACKVNNEIKRLQYKLKDDGEIELINIGTKDGMRIYRRGLVYIVAKAIREVYPKALLTVKYQLHHALLCEIENMEITDEVMEKINQRVAEIVASDLPITKKTMTREEAEEFYERENTLKGKLQLDTQDKKGVTLYYCENYYNYFYGILPISTGYAKKYEIVKYHDNRFLIRFPSSKTPTILEQFKESPKLLKTLDEYEELHKIFDINTVDKLNKSIRENKIKEYILLDEALHEKKIVQIADNIVKNEDIKVVAIARTVFFR